MIIYPELIIFSHLLPRWLLYHQQQSTLKCEKISLLKMAKQGFVFFVNICHQEMPNRCSVYLKSALDFEEVSSYVLQLIGEVGFQSFFRLSNRVLFRMLGPMVPWTPATWRL